ncbi:MAG: trypsin-like peptidase domain-containing protein [Alphaproteobacteria bacterium]|nr:trypsin-like peptidase domain-containing protein [Alphaproteobacteria bacterium]
MLTVTLDPQITEMSGSGKHIFATPDAPIRFGRSLDCDIKFSASDTRLGRNHFELRPAASSYELVTDRVHPVFLYGDRVLGTIALTEVTELRLVDAKTGPWVKIEIAQTADGGITDPGFKSDGGTVQQSMKHVRNLAIGLCAALALFGSYSAYQWHKQDVARQAYLNDTAALVEKISSLQNHAPSGNWTKVGETLLDSVYQVALKSNDNSKPDPKGTAWVASDHTLITNAHVAALFEEAARNNQTLVVIPPRNANVAIPVIGVKIHPAYQPFRDALAKIERENNVKLNALGSYDVALLEVAPSASLAPKLTIAKAEALQNIKAGEQIAYAGYPAQDAKDKYAEQMHFGYVSGSTDFLGVAGRQQGQLFYHTAAASNGASGSPIVNSAGEVIGVLSGGEKTELADQFIISGSGTFYGQSASLIDDLENGWDEPKSKAQATAWQNAMLYLARRDEIWSTLADYRNGKSMQALAVPPAFQSKAQITQSRAKSTGAQAMESWRNVEPGTYMAFVVGDESQPDKSRLGLRVSTDQAVLQSPLYLNEAPTALFTISTPTTVTFAIEGTVGQPYWLQVVKLDDAIVN